jgi:pyruvyltransferase
MPPRSLPSNRRKSPSWKSRIMWLLGFLIVVLGVVAQFIQLMNASSTTTSGITNQFGPGSMKEFYSSFRDAANRSGSKPTETRTRKYPNPPTTGEKSGPGHTSPESTAGRTSNMPSQKKESNLMMEETWGAAPEKQIDLTTTWPLKPPKEIFPRIDDCHVVFRDPAMATCNLGAFGGNFGDLLGPDIVKRIVEYKFGCSARSLSVLDFASTENTTIWNDRPCLWSVGSVWRNVRANDHVWGTGSIGVPREFGLCKGTRQGSNLNITVYSARGPKTVDMLKQNCRRIGLKFITADGGVSTQASDIVPRGDAGFLIPFLFPEFPRYQQDKADIEKCLIFHVYDQRENYPVDLPQEAMLPAVQPWPTMAGNITRCKMLVSSSLHGVILGDAFGVPVRWLHKGLAVLPPKFYDYFESFPRGHWNASFEGNIKRALDTSGVYANPVPLDAEYRSEYAQMIMKTFPFDLFTTKSGQPKNLDEGKDVVSELLDLQKQRRKVIDNEVKTVVGKILEISTKRENSIAKSSENAIDLTTAWPLKSPKEVFPEFDDCRVVFRDPAMATCNLGAFGGNFGDLLGPDIVKRIVEYKFGCSAKTLPALDFASTENTTIWNDRPCLWSVGSVWRNVRANDHVWGTGTLGTPREFGLCKGTERGSNLNITVYSARGPKTVHELKKFCRNRGLKFITTDGGVSSKTSSIVPRGDAGFLIPFMFPEFPQYQQDKADIEKCLIYHVYDQRENDERGSNRVDLPQEAVLPAVQPWPTMVGNITRCKMLVSSSLHGVIMADAFGVPVRWMHKATAVSEFKFYDYFESFPRGHWNASFDKNVKRALDTSGAGTFPVPLDAEYRSEYAQMIMKTFPFDLFTTKS